MLVPAHGAHLRIELGQRTARMLYSSYMFSFAFHMITPL